MKRIYFGTDGVRGPYGSSGMNEAFAYRLGAAAARFVAVRGTGVAKQVVIGRDTRASGPSLERALAAGLAAEGLAPVSLGVVPSPVVSLMTRERSAALGVVITASHNPASDNGIKFFGPAGIKLTDAEEAEIERLLSDHSGAPLLEVPTLADPLDGYLALASRILPPQSLAGWNIVLDTANGAACVTSRRVLESLGATLVLVGNEPDGANINAGVGSQHPEEMARRVLASSAQLGIAHDGDADRCVLCDERGEVLDGDEVLTLLAVHALQRGRLAARTLVITVQSNLGVDAAIAAAGGRVCRTQVGDRYVIERMLQEKASLGGESSGHVICAEISPTGDGLVAALKVIEVMHATGRPLSELRRSLRRFPQGTAALTVREKVALDLLPDFTAEIAAVERDLAGTGRVLVRYSGTEPKLRLLVEGSSDEVVRDALAKLERAARRALEVIGN